MNRTNLALLKFEERSSSNINTSSTMLSAELNLRIKQEDPFELGESYARGEWEAEALDAVMVKVFSQPAPQSLRAYARALRHLLRNMLSNPQRPRRAFEIAEAHYNLGNDLFQVMLDRSFSYTCAYWKSASSLDEAQEAKLDLVCRKLDLKPGMRVLDIGCGWGNFAKFAAEHYGSKVVGITVSEEQAALARARCAGLPVEIRVEDYRSLHGVFDHVVSIEMIEAVGRYNLHTFFDVVHRVLKPGGMFLLEVISSEVFSRGSSWASDQFFLWITKYIFPNGYLPRIDELMAPCRQRFILEDVHSFGTDYDRTLLCWEANFSRDWHRISHRYDDTFARRWRYYLLGCAALFRLRIVQLYQILYAKAEIAP